MNAVAAAPAITVGETFSRTVTLDARTIHEFALAAGDHNPLHHDVAFAESTRFGGIIASGTHYVALIMGLVASHFTALGHTAAGLEFSFQLKKPVRAGDTITLTWTVAEITPKESLKGDILTLNGTITTQDGVVVLTCIGKIVVFHPA
jgi:acyl dehydratase